MVYDHILVKGALGLRDAGRGFLLSLRASNRYSPRYLDALEFSLALYADYANQHDWPAGAGEVTTAHVEEYLSHLQQRAWAFGAYASQQGRRLSQSSIETHYRRLKRFHGWLKQRGHAAENPLDLIPHPHVDEKVIATVPDAAAQTLLMLLEPSRVRTGLERFYAVRNRAALLLLLDTPGRLAELTGLELGQVDLDGGMVKVMGKGRKERWMPIGGTAASALWEWVQIRASVARQSERAVWVDRRGRAMRAQWLYQMLCRLGERAEMRLHTHQFRHTYLMAGVRANIQEKLLELVSGTKRIPPTYRRTLGAEDAAPLRAMSPADRLSRREGGARGLRGRRL